MSTETVPKGYKRTEVGVIPEEWDVRFLPEICLFRGGKAHEQFVSDNGQYVCVNSKFISSDGFVRKYSTVNLCPANKGDIVMVKSDLPNGKALAKAFIADQDDLYAVNQSLCVLTPYQDSSEFLFYALNRNPYFLKFNNGVTQTHLLNPVFKKCKIIAPTKVAEQQAIAAALSDADALIESLEQLLAKKRQIKQGAMQELLTGKRRLPGFSGGWCEVILSNFLLSSPDYGINAPGVPDTGAFPRYLRITDITDDGRFSPPVQTAVNHPESSRYILSKDEIVFARTGASVGKSYLYKDADGELVFAGFLIRARIDPSKLSPEYLAAYTHTADYWNWVRLMSMRSGQPGINGQEYASMSFRIPPTLPEQAAIASVLSDMDAELEVLEAKLDKARQVKQGMMQQLLTGKVRLV